MTAFASGEHLQAGALHPGRGMGDEGKACSLALPEAVLAEAADLPENPSGKSIPLAVMPLTYRESAVSPGPETEHSAVRQGVPRMQ